MSGPMGLLRPILLVLVNTASAEFTKGTGSHLKKNLANHNKNYFNHFLNSCW